jgi:threonyl-tRNA synthetase
VVIHRAVSGSFERFIAILIEHFAGNFPLWLAPEQVRVIPITDGQNEYAAQIADQLKEQGVRISADLGTDRMNGKIRQAQLMKVPYMLVVGANEAEAGVVSLRMRDGSQQNNIPLAEFTARIKDRIARRASEL